MDVNLTGQSGQIGKRGRKEYGQSEQRRDRYTR